ncbi:MAG TPA: ABC transporter ATP-binding protein [Gemmatimonadaceae bacterium]
MITISGLEKRYGAQHVLRGVNVEVGRGSVTAVVGPNGAGKTTLIKAILGLVQPDAGAIRVDDLLVGEDCSYRARIGYMPQIARYPHNLTARELLTMLTELRKAAPNAGPMRRDESLIAQLGLTGQLDKPLRALSGGTRQKVNAVAAFLFSPDLLILDEPTAGLDPAASEVLKDRILAERAAGRTVIVTSHFMSELEELATDVVFLLEGTVRYAGPLDELLRRTRKANLGRAISHLMLEAAAA